MFQPSNHKVGSLTLSCAHHLVLRVKNGGRAKLTGSSAACRARAGPAGWAGTSRGPHCIPEAPGPRPGARPLSAGTSPFARTFHAVRRYPRKETRSPAHAAGSARASLPLRPSRRHLWLRRSSSGGVRCCSAGPARLPRERAPGSPRGPEAVPTSCPPAGPTSPEGLPREVSPARAPSSASRTPLPSPQRRPARFAPLSRSCR